MIRWQHGSIDIVGISTDGKTRRSTGVVVARMQLSWVENGQHLSTAIGWPSGYRQQFDSTFRGLVYWHFMTFRRAYRVSVALNQTMTKYSVAIAVGAILAEPPTTGTQLPDSANLSHISCFHLPCAEYA